jgi:putative spermidine/putrescine transport system permease protein
MKSSLDWAFASALGAMLLAGVLVIYWLYNKLVGIDNIKLG